MLSLFCLLKTGLFLLAWKSILEISSMGRQWIVVLVLYGAGICIINAYTSSQIDDPVSECFQWNFDHILCRWNHCYNSSEIRGQNYSFSVTVEFNKKTRTICTNSSSSCKSYCLWKIASHWVNKSLSIKIITNKGSIRNITEIKFSKRKNAIMLSPPILNIMKHLSPQNEVNATVKITYDEFLLQRKVMNYGCGDPLINIIYKRVPKEDDSCVDEDSTSSWKNQDSNPWVLDDKFKEDAVSKFYSESSVELILDELPTYSNYIIKARWKLNGTACIGKWSPYQSRLLNTDIMSICPINMNVKPGSDASLVCKSIEKISNFTWRIINQATNVETDIIVPSDGYSSSLNVKNFTTPAVDAPWPILKVECMSKEFSGFGGVNVGVGYPPIKPQMECIMQDLEKMYCRWNTCNAWTDRMKEVSVTENNLTWAGHTCQSVVQNGTCKQIHSGCFSSCILSSEEKDCYKYYTTVNITVVAKNKFGLSSTTLSIHPHSKIIPSPPELEVGNIHPEKHGGTIVLNAKFPTTSEYRSYFSRYCTEVNLKIRYQIVNHSLDIRRVNFLRHDDFWNNWLNGNDDLNEMEPIILHGGKVLIVDGKLPAETLDDMDPIQVPIRNLSAKTSYIFKVQWKINCSSNWSIPHYIKATIGDLYLPQFYQTSLIFFMPNGSFPTIFSDLNLNVDSSLLVWNRFQDNSTNLVQKSNTVLYHLSSDNASCLVPSSSNNIFHTNFVSMTIQRNAKCRVKVNATNSVDYQTSPSFQRMEMGNEACSLRVVSIKPKLGSEPSLKFDVKWVYSKMPGSSDCDRSKLEKLEAHLLTWRENCSQCSDNANKDNASWLSSSTEVNSFTMEIARTETKVLDDYGLFGVRSAALNSTVKFEYPFQRNTAYGIAVSISTEQRGVMFQSATLLADDLYYLQHKSANKQAQRSIGAPAKIFCKDVGPTTLQISWQLSKPQFRHGPIQGYEIFYTTNKSCFNAHDMVSCEQNAGYSKKCFENSVIKNESSDLHNSSGPWTSESRKYGLLRSYRLTQLSPGTNYYIGVREINKGGVSRCFRHISQATKHSNYALIVCILLALLAAAVMSGVAVKFKQRVKRVFRRDVPKPAIWVDWHQSTNAEETAQALCDDSVDSYVGLSHPLETADELFEAQYHLTEKDSELPFLISPPDDANQQFLTVEERENLNNNLIEKCLGQNTEFLEEHLETVASYAFSSREKRRSFVHEDSSQGSDEPCCSTSTGDGSSPVSDENSACGYGSDSRYISTNEATNMSRLLNLGTTSVEVVEPSS